MSNAGNSIEKGIFQGGNAKTLTQVMDLNEEDILYIGDHIYGDIVRLKQECNWRTGLVIEELEQDLKSLVKTEPLNSEVLDLMEKKQPLEEKIVDIITEQKETGVSEASDKFKNIQNQISSLDINISENIKKNSVLF